MFYLTYFTLLGFSVLATRLSAQEVYVPHFTEMLPGSVAGSVVDAVDGLPLAGVVIHLGRLPDQVEISEWAGNSDTRSIESDAAGHFGFSAIQVGSYILSPDTPRGYSHGHNRSPARYLTVSKESAVTETKFSFIRDSRISGKVVNTAGESIKGVLVRAFSHVRETGPGVDRLHEVSRGTTDSAGHFSLRGLPADRYVLLASALESLRGACSSNDESHGTSAQIPTFWPSVSEVDASLPIDLSSGEGAEDITIALQERYTHSVVGRVESTSETANKNPSEVVLVPTDTRGTNLTALAQTAAVGPDQTFCFRAVLPGTYIFKAIESGVSKLAVISQTVIVGSSGTTETVLRYGSSAHLTGRITVNGLDDGNLSQVSAVLFPLASLTGSPSIAAHLDSKGYLIVPNLECSKYRIRITTTAPGMYLGSISLGDHTITDSILDLLPGNNELSVTLRMGAATLDGTIVSRDNSANYKSVAVVYSTGATPDDVEGTVIPVSNGKMLMTGLKPGRYYAVATQLYDAEIFADTRFRQQISSSFVSIAIDENQTKAVVLPLLSYKDVVESALRSGFVMF